MTTLPTPGPCTPPCWTKIRCERCGRTEAPRGRSVSIYAAGAYCSCPDVRGYAGTARHLWDEHDRERWRFDPEGEKAHLATCERCRPEGDHEDAAHDPTCGACVAGINPWHTH